MADRLAIIQPDPAYMKLLEKAKFLCSLMVIADKTPIVKCFKPFYYRAFRNWHVRKFGFDVQLQ